jgi:septal ring factor EnvC (AmiA/AmiB activator)
MSRISPLLIVLIFLCANLARAEESQGTKVRLVAAVDESVREGYERLFQQLGVDDSTRTKLTERLQPLEQRSIELQEQRREAVENLEDLVKELEDSEAEMESPALKQALDQLYTADDALRVLRGERSRVFRETLSPKQQLLLVVLRLQEKWERMHGQGRDSEHGNGEEPQYVPQNLPKQARLE